MLSLPVVQPDVLYPIATFSSTFGVGRHALQAARKAGLPVKYSAGKGWLLGRDWIDHVQRHGLDEHHRSGESA